MRALRCQDEERPRRCGSPASVHRPSGACASRAAQRSGWRRAARAVDRTAGLMWGTPSNCVHRRQQMAHGPLDTLRGLI